MNTGILWIQRKGFLRLLLGIALSFGVLATGGSETAAQEPPQIQVHYQNYDWVQGTVEPNAWVEITLKNANNNVKGVYKDRANSDGWFGNWCILDSKGNCVDIEPGDTVEVLHNEQGLEVIPVVPITGAVDSATNTIRGKIISDDMPTELRAEIWTRDGPSKESSTDENGNFSVDFSPYDVGPGHWVNIWYTNTEGHQVGAVFSELRLEVDVTLDNINGMTHPGRSVDLVLQASDSSIKEQFAHLRPSYEGQYDANISEDIMPGDVILAASNPSTSVYVEELTVEVDAERDIVSGTAPKNAWLTVGVDGGSWWYVKTNNIGAFSVEFSPEVDIGTCDSGSVNYETPAGHWLYYRFYVPCEPLVRVNQSHDWVEGKAPLPNNWVKITVTDALGIEKGTYADWSKDDRWFGGWCALDHHDNCVDIIAGDTVHVDMGGEVISVPVISMDGVVDAETDTISGKIEVGNQANVYAELWTASYARAEGKTDPSGNYKLSFPTADVLEGYSVALWYIQPDGNQVGIVRSALRMEVGISDDLVSGSTAPLAPLSITVRGKGVSSTVADEEGNYWSEIYNADGELVDILPGDEIDVAGAGHTATVVVPDQFSANIDAGTDTISGQGLADAELWVDVYGYGSKEVTVPAGGSWSVWFGDQDDIQEGDRGEVNYYTDEGHRVQLRFYGKYLQVRVNQSHNWIDGQTTPGSTIVATVWRDGLPAMAQKTDNGRGEDWKLSFCCGVEHQLQTGDVVEVRTSLGQTARVELIPIDANVDAENDKVSGHINGVPLPATIRTEVWEQDGTSVEGQTKDGSFEYDLGYDLLPAHLVYISYITPNGHQVGIIRHALRLDVEVPADMVSGNTAPNTEVTVSVNGETATTTSDVHGNFSNLGFDHDIVIGDTVQAWANSQYVKLLIPNVSADIDATKDKVSGYAPVNPRYDDNLNIGVDYDWRWTSTNGSGYYEVSFDQDIAQGDWLKVEYRYPEGHSVYYGFGLSDVRVENWAPIRNVSPGDEFTFIIRPFNDLSGTATNVHIVDRLPEHVIYVPHPDDWNPSYDEGTRTLTWDIAALGGERGREIELHLLLDGDESLLGGRLRNQVEISASNDRDSSNNSSSASVDIRPPGTDYRVQVEQVTGHAIAGGDITYRVRFANWGNRDGEGVMLRDNLPANTSWVGSTFEVREDGESETVDTSQVIWQIGTLPVGQEREFEFTLQVNKSTPQDTFLINMIEISPDTNPLSDNRDNLHRISTVVEPAAADLWVDMSIEGDLSSMDAEIIYRTTFRNDGNLSADNVTITNVLPPEISYLWNSAGSDSSVAKGAITWEVGSVPPGAGGELVIGGRLDGQLTSGTVLTSNINGATTTYDLDINNNYAKAELGTPRAIAVPWVGDEPHRIWSGLETTLKGIAKGYSLTRYEWDFGDGSPAIEGFIDDPYAVDAKHTYIGDVGDTFVATLTVWGDFGLSNSDSYPVQIFDRVHGVEKDVAIDEALWYQHKSAWRYRYGGLDYAEWGGWGDNVAQNAAAIQAFQLHGHLADGDPLEDPYVEDVQAGWNALLAYAKLDAMSVQPAGDPDTNANGVGIGIYQDYDQSIYETGLAMMALASTNTRGRVARTGPYPHVRGQTYQNIVQDMVDWFAWGQNDADPNGESDRARGGWGYQPNSGDSDNSNTQFPVLGLAGAEDNWRVTVPQFGRDELLVWLANTQNPENGAFGSTDAWGMLDVGKTGAGIIDLVWAGVDVNDERVVKAAQYIQRHWADSPNQEKDTGNVGDFYTMYAVKKGSQLAGINNYGSHYWDLEYTTYLVDIQQPDARINEDANLGLWFRDRQPMSTSWALLILSEGLYKTLPVAIVSPYQYGKTKPVWYEGQVQFDGTLSHRTDPDHELVSYVWDFGDGELGSGKTPYHTYADNGRYAVVLSATDNLGKTDSDTLLLTVANLPPVIRDFTVPTYAIANHPVEISAVFTDPGSADSHTATVEWGDGVSGAAGVDQSNRTVSASHRYANPGIYTITLTVMDDDGGSDTEAYETLIVLPLSAVTDSSLCYFDREPEADGEQFRLIFTPDVQNWPAYKLSASSPYKFVYNIFYTGDDLARFSISLPEPFVTQGTTPVRVYSQVSIVNLNGVDCFEPDPDSEIYAGDSLGLSDVLVPDGFLYIAIHAAYGLNGTTGYIQKSTGDAVDKGTGEAQIPNLHDYTFTVSGSQNDSQTIQNSNIFKRIPGIAGLVQGGDNNPVPNVQVDLYNPDGMWMQTITTNEDGWYLFEHKHTSKPARYTVEIPEYGLSESVLLEPNQFVEVNFTIN